LFVIETYLAEPALFDHYAAVDPSLWWDREALSLSAAARLSAAQASKSLYIAIAAEQAAEPAAANRLLGALRSRGLKVCEQWRTGLTHATIYQQVTPVALQEMLPPTSAPPPEYGFKVDCVPAR
jgi:predicted alpha/beta superfamily hydrolase